MASITASRPVAARAARAGLWLLPIYGLLLGLSTLTHQPPVDAFDEYARYITTDVFLVSHLGASIFGAALAVLGAAALTTHLVKGRAAGTAVTGLVLTTVANIFLAAAFGSAAFVQPGIGRAHLTGVPGMPALNDDTAYGSALVMTASGATLLMAIGAVVMGVAIARTDPRLRWYGVAYSVLLVLFGLGVLVQILQPFAGFGFAIATGALAVRLGQSSFEPRQVGREPVPAASSLRSA
jgi:hypothetical protein